MKRKLRIEPLEDRWLLTNDMPYIDGVGWQAGNDDSLFVAPTEEEYRAMDSGTANLALRRASLLSQEIIPGPQFNPILHADPLNIVPYNLGMDFTGATYDAGLNNTKLGYLIGTVHVTLVLFESNGTIDPSTEDWDAGRIQHVIDEIQLSLDWWTDTFNAYHPNSIHKLIFTLDTTHALTPIDTGYEPIIHTQAEQTLWIDDFTSFVGYNDPSLGLFADVKNWNDSQRIVNNTNWSFTIFIGDSLNDSDGQFKNQNSSAYAYLGGPFWVGSWDMNGWGSNKIDRIAAHETGHIGQARDEYDGGHSYLNSYGYYSTQLTNAATNRPPEAGPQQNSIMATGSKLENSWSNNTLPQSTREILGWRDTDGDSRIDIFDLYDNSIIPQSTLGSDGLDIAAIGRHIGDGSQYEVTVAGTPELLEAIPGGITDSSLTRVNAVQFRVGLVPIPNNPSYYSVWDVDNDGEDEIMQSLGGFFNLATNDLNSVTPTIAIEGTFVIDLSWFFDSDNYCGAFCMGGGIGPGPDELVMEFQAVSADDIFGMGIETGILFFSLKSDELVRHTLFTPGISVISQPPIFTSEDGLVEGSFDVVLDYIPTDNVIIDITSLDPTEGTTSPTQLIFTPLNATDKQTVTINGVEDTEIDGDITYDLSFNVISNDTNYDGLSISNISVTNTDNDFPFIVVDKFNIITSEDETIDTVMVNLSHQPPPGDIVVLDGDTDNHLEAQILSLPITFDEFNWDTPQPLDFIGIDDDIPDGDMPYLATIFTDIVFTTWQAWLNEFNQSQDINGINLDNETAPIPDFDLIINNIETEFPFNNHSNYVIGSALNMLGEEVLDNAFEELLGNNWIYRYDDLVPSLSVMQMQEFNMSINAIIQSMMPLMRDIGPIGPDGYEEFIETYLLTHADPDALDNMVSIYQGF